MDFEKTRRSIWKFLAITESPFFFEDLKSFLQNSDRLLRVAKDINIREYLYNLSEVGVVRRHSRDKYSVLLSEAQLDRLFKQFESPVKKA